MKQKEETLTFLPARLDHEPVIWRGMSNTELFTVVGMSFAFWLPVCVIVGLIFGAGILGAGVSALLTMVTVFFAGGRLQSYKAKSSRRSSYR